MNDLETQVRSILSDLADGAPPSNGLVQTLHARRRRARHRRLAVATAAAIVAVLAAGAATVELRKPDATLEVTTPTETHSGLPPAPVHVGKLPSGFGQTRVTIFDTGRWTIWTTRQKPDAELDVSIRPTKPSVNPWPGVELKAEKMSVGGRPATLTATPVNQGDSLATLRFERKPGQWIDVSVLSRDTTNPFAAVSKAELRAVALGLTDRPTPVAELLRVGSVPDPLKICASHDGSGEQYDTSSVAFCDPRVKTLPVELNATLPGVPDNAGVQLYWQHINGEWWREQKNGTQRAPIKVDGREGEVAEAGTAAQRLWYGWIRLSNDVVVNVEMREPNLFTRSQFIEFLGSVTPGEALK